MGIINNTTLFIRMPMRLYVCDLGCPMSFPARIIAKIAKSDLQVLLADAESKKMNPSGNYPMLVTPMGNLHESLAIAKFLAADVAGMLGASAEDKARIDQWIFWSFTGHLNDQRKALQAIFGKGEVTQAEFTDSMNKAKGNAKTLNVALKGKDWLVGSAMTLADIVLACHFMNAQQVLIDGGFRKAMPDFSNWFERVVKVDAFVAVAGNVRACAKSVKPTVKAEEKKAAAPKQQAPKKDAGDDQDGTPKKPKSALELLPETKFDLFNFKTFFVNEADKSGSAVDEFLKMYDAEGWSCWHMHYEMYKGEGEKLFMTENMLDGYLQRWEDFRKWSFGKMCILGTDSKQEIKGLFMWRGQVIPQECIDHPSFEYYKTTKLDIINKPEDLAELRRYWGAMPDQVIDDMPVIVARWQK